MFLPWKIYNIFLIDLENNTKKVGDATSYYIKMALASLTLLENAYKSVNFNFQEETLSFLDGLIPQIKQCSQKDYDAYTSLIREMGLEGRLVIRIQALLVSPWTDVYIEHVFSSHCGAIWKINNHICKELPSRGLSIQ